VVADELVESWGEVFLGVLELLGLGDCSFFFRFRLVVRDDEEVILSVQVVGFGSGGVLVLLESISSEFAEN